MSRLAVLSYSRRGGQKIPHGPLSMFILASNMEVRKGFAVRTEEKGDISSISTDHTRCEKGAHSVSILASIQPLQRNKCITSVQFEHSSPVENVRHTQIRHVDRTTYMFRHAFSIDQPSYLKSTSQQISYGEECSKWPQAPGIAMSFTGTTR